jgi:predicted N-acetyltransferase YhbS
MTDMSDTSKQSECQTRIRPIPLRVDHLPQALELSRALNWPYRLQDWEFAFRLGRGFAVEEDGRLLGTALWWPYGDRHASTGMIIVAAEAQRRGIGAALMHALLEDAAGRTIILNSTEEGFGLYSRLGFVAYDRVHQHQAVLAAAPALEVDEGIRPCRLSDHPAVREIDRAASGLNREALIDALLQTADTLVVERDGEITGYGCVRIWGRGVVIGPVIAANADDARALIAILAARHVGEFVRIDVPASTDLSPWLESVGLPCVDHVVAMARGDRPSVAADRTLFALSNQSLG